MGTSITPGTPEASSETEVVVSMADARRLRDWARTENAIMWEIIESRNISQQRCIVLLEGIEDLGLRTRLVAGAIKKTDMSNHKRFVLLSALQKVNQEREELRAEWVLAIYYWIKDESHINSVDAYRIGLIWKNIWLFEDKSDMFINAATSIPWQLSRSEAMQVLTSILAYMRLKQFGIWDDERRVS